MAIFFVEIWHKTKMVDAPASRILLCILWLCIADLICQKRESLLCSTAGRVLKEGGQVGGVDQAGGLLVVRQAGHHLDDLLYKDKQEKDCAVMFHHVNADMMMSTTLMMAVKPCTSTCSTMATASSS